MPYIKKQPNPNFQEPVFIPKTKIVDSEVIEGFGKWTLDEDGLLTIEGTGRMPDWEACWDSDRDEFTIEGGGTWHRVKEKIESVRIADTVLSIGDEAFYFCKNLESIIIPNSVTSIGGAAFMGCDRLESINLPNNVMSIWHQAFSCCKSLKSIIIPKSVRYIENDVFEECDSLKYVKMPEKFNCLFFKSKYGISKKYVEFY